MLKTLSRSAALWIVAVSVATSGTPAIAPASPFQSHAPARPLPQPSDRALPNGPMYFVDGVKGDDAAEGTLTKPWRTLSHGMQQLKPGHTLVLRGGTYHEHVTGTLSGTAEKPITIRSHASELVILDGGLPEFLESPATAWEPYAEGAADEYRSTNAYPGAGSPDGDLRVGLLGNFADSMTPLQGYWSHGDLQSDNPYFNLNEDGAKKGKVGGERHVYCGPGVWYDADTGRLHCRLAPTKLPGLGDDNYRGETDPRKTPLIIAPWASGSVLTLHDSRHVRLQDLVLRGARQHTLVLDGGSQLELDGLTVYGGQSCIKVDGVKGFRMSHTACRGLAAPWTFRGSLKYRSIESRLLTTAGWDPTGADGCNYEIAYCEFTDSVDGIFIGNIHRVSFHHNLVENVSDDGLFVTAATAYDGTTPGGGHDIYQNRFARVLTAFAFGVGHGRQKVVQDGPPRRWGARQLGGGLKIFRNVFDFRQPVWYYWPTGPDAPQDLTSRGRFAGDHGGPAWESMAIFHNTILSADPPRYEYATDGFSRAVESSTRFVHNNIVCQLVGLPGQYFPEGKTDFDADSNLLWSVSEGATATLQQPRYPRDYVPPKAEWGAHDKFADPKFVAFDADWRKPADLRLRADSPAVDAGDDLGSLSDVAAFRSDEGLPDIGAIPVGTQPWRVGCFGRIDVCGNAVAASAPIERFDWALPSRDSNEPAAADARAAIVRGYPSFDAPLVKYALRKAGATVDEFTRTWLDPRNYAKYGVVIIDGSLARAGVTPTAFSDEELPIVRDYLQQGGTLWLFRERTDLFTGEAGQRMLADLIGRQPRDNSSDFSVRLPTHRWVAQFSQPGADASWLEKIGGGLHFEHGETIVGTSGGKTILARVNVGKGQLVYLGWSPAAMLPNGRVPPTVADERRFADQMQIITNIVDEVTTKKSQPDAP